MSTVVHAALNEPARLDELLRLRLLDTPPEKSFDRLTWLAAHVLGAPVALVSLVDDHRQFFKSAYGLPEPWASRRQTPLSHSFCQHVVASSLPLVIEDARKHPLVCDNLATSELNVVAYLGIPLITPNGRTLGSFCVIDTRARTWSATEQAVLTELAASVMSEIALRCSHDELFAVNARLQQEAAERERAIEALGQAEARMSEYRREVSHMARVATAGEMATIMAHELNQPLATIALTANATARLAASGRLDAGELQAHLVDIADQAKRASEIIRQTRNYVRKEPQSKTPVDLDRVIRDVLRLLRPIQQRLGVEVELVHTGGHPHVLGIEVQLVQMLVNLVRNAEDAVGDNPRSERRVRISTLLPDADHVAIEVEDNGPGIPSALAGRIFGPFFSTRKNGLGMGLAISKTIAEDHDAILSFESRDGGRLSGTTFRIVFPACPK